MVSADDITMSCSNQCGIGPIILTFKPPFKPPSRLPDPSSPPPPGPPPLSASLQRGCEGFHPSSPLQAPLQAPLRRRVTGPASPSRCASREQEIVAKQGPSCQDVEEGALKLKNTHNKPLFVENSTEFMVCQALRRRGLASNFADLISCEVQQEWVDSLFQEIPRSR